MPRPKRSIPEFRLRKLDGKSNYYICWSEDRRSKRVSTGTGDPVAAQRYLADWIAGWNAPACCDNPTVSEIMDAYLEHKKISYEQANQSDKNYAALEYSLDPLREVIGHMEVSQSLRQSTRKYVTKKLNEGLSPATVRRQLDILVAALNFAHREDWIDKVPAIEKPPPPPPRDLWMSQDQVRRFLEECKTPHVRLFALLAFHTLSRKSAILELKWSQVDLQHRLIDFNPPGRTRTNKRRVPVKINDTLYEALRKAREFALSEYVIEYNGAPVGDIKKAFQRAGMKAGMIWVTPHVLRHTGATLLARSGVSMWEIAGIMGDRLATVERHYAKHHPSFLENAVSTLDELYSQ